MKRILSSVLVAGMLLSVGATQALAIGGPSGPKIDWQVQGKLGAVKLNPYGLAPLTAIIMNNGYVLSDVSVKILPKKNGQTISYKVDNQTLKTYGGIPIFGLYPAYKNQVEVKYTKSAVGFKNETITETYQITTGPVGLTPSGLMTQTGMPYESVKVTKVDKEFANRLYLINNAPGKMPGRGSQAVWNNPSGGALEWNDSSNAFIVDTTGEVRWYFDSDKILDPGNIYRTGIQMGFRQDVDGALAWGFGQRYVKYDLMGREIFNRQLPLGYNDFSHSLNNAQNGNYLLRVGSSNTKRPDGKNVRTVRDTIVEVDKNGNVVDDWRLYEILDPYRNDVILSLDQGAVCLNIDASKAGQTISEEELAKLDSSDAFGDIAGTGTGRNWAHVNSVDYDPNDDSIVISSRHQSAMIKIGRDKKVKWIAGAHKGWSDKFKDKLLQPVDSKGNKIVCEDGYSKCPGYLNEKGGFDWTWTQHTAFIIDSKTNKDILYLAAFDNGDGRGLEQPALSSMKYSRAVVYKIDQKNMTIEQVWEYGKERGGDWFSAVTSLTEYQGDKDSILVYSATAGMQFDLSKGVPVGDPAPELLEFKWGSNKPSVQMRFTGTGIGYQAMPISLEKAFKR
ncbi:Putative arylsulfate sulfotransferase [Campylobacter sputorum subsp. bubulus]|uniref:Arylsulfate sulfotransferase n=1 Tax=Campylobacter sputorum subsp. sputorum TaxID=32024 RepID=A0A381DK44_9BACT|nr:aryl-sulfate sulfotransferase [Campylobacter sputorum]ASM34322.1 arylsulfate sulfotransferase [Campylobacter sputorum aubsp. sputorum RM3237]KAB0582285.1 aryl-sulfate sulfotransferase [Campylobacter sputorum subsp. sputorum]QEL04513.1 arylsulfate sulfotransferase [Campylobacter sputorum subsp. sputorum]SUX09288.1 Putative arylsulfate sulfotransferase [Campylobacter sputorum subsp. bubulus]SUX10980.1 Putative arylsulfate sulfotransferase [Campylobacter sputorum subsp. sputorum]